MEYLQTTWRSVPSIAAAFPQMAARDAPVNYTIIADMGVNRSPILIAASLPEDIANHIVELHNKSI